MNFKTRSYFEWIWNAIKSVEHTPRIWDLYDLDETIINHLLVFLPYNLKNISSENSFYNDYKRLLLLLIIYRNYDITYERELKNKKEIGQLIWKHFFSFWL